jgi:hypothetical protein
MLDGVSARIYMEDMPQEIYVAEIESTAGSPTLDTTAAIGFKMLLYHSP